ncbi:MAG UNVERIFIED_CONTAM: type VI secretion system contractile sheath small subunit [Planctomycetaceae bacterium]|jgi:type VI secretion system protein ImpB
MGKSSLQHKLDRVRKPRVHITYDVEIGDARVKKELPFVMGVMGDFSGNPTKALDPLSKRKFVNIDRDNFNDVMASIRPELNLRVANTLQNNGTELPVQLSFRSMDDFDPANIVNQVPALKALLESRNKIRDLLTTMDQSEGLESQLERILSDTDKIRSLAADMGADGSDQGGK